MRPRAWQILTTVTLISLMNAATATHAEEAGYYANNEIASMRAQVQALQARLDAGGYDANYVSACDDCCRDAGWFAGAEIAFLKPHSQNGLGASSVFAMKGTNDVGGVGARYDAAPRVWFGYQNCDGLGFRLRYWEFKQDYSTPAAGDTVFGIVNGNAIHGFNTWVLDAEVIDSSKLGCHWDATYSGGVRYLEYTETAGLIGATPATTYVVADSVNAVGLTTSLELRRDVTCSLGIFGIVRGSVLYGDETDSFVGGVTVVERQLNDVKAIYEMQMGVEYLSGSYFARLGVEAQYWSGFGVDNQPIDKGNVVLPFSNTSTGFAGGFFAVGANW